jgi:hypothetical protein
MIIKMDTTFSRKPRHTGNHGQPNNYLFSKKYHLLQVRLEKQKKKMAKRWTSKLNSLPFGYNEKIQACASKRSVEERIITNLHGRIKSKLSKLPPSLQIDCSREKFLQFLGCKPSQLKQHIEHQFSSVNIPVCWANYGKLWELDHEIPVSLLELKKLRKPTHKIITMLTKVISHLSNIQPLSKSQNCVKRDHLTEQALGVLKKQGLLCSVLT